MIKIFGQLRYHWQPDVSILIIYWSLSVIPIFIGLSLMYESSDVPTLVLFLLFLFMVLLGVGVHRYFTIYENGILRIITANPFTPSKIDIATIRKVAVTKTSITLYFNGKEKNIAILISSLTAVRTGALMIGGRCIMSIPASRS